MVRLKEVTRIYRQGAQEIRALDGVSLEVPRAEFLVINGRSGCGKSTLLGIMGALDLPTAGRVFIDGQELSRMSEQELTLFRRSFVGTIFQSYNLIPILSVLENVALPLLLGGMPEAEAKARALALLREVELAHRRNHLPHEISGGELQRTAIARALVAGPKLVIADEPTGNLDSKTALTVLALLARLNKKYETTVVLATHSREADGFADRILHMQDGRFPELA